MSGNKELLELAARAAGYIPNGVSEEGYFLVSIDGNKTYGVWNPLENDAQALRLAVKLRMAIEYDSEYLDQPAKNVYVQAQGYDAFEPLCYDPYAATRRAIVRAAAEIGRTI